MKKNLDPVTEMQRLANMQRKYEALSASGDDDAAQEMVDAITDQVKHIRSMPIDTPAHATALVELLKEELLAEADGTNMDGPRYAAFNELPELDEFFYPQEILTLKLVRYMSNLPGHSAAELGMSGFLGAVEAGRRHRIGSTDTVPVTAKEPIELSVSERLPELQRLHDVMLKAPLDTGDDAMNAYAEYRDRTFSAPIRSAADIACLIELFKVSFLVEYPDKLFGEIGVADESYLASEVALRLVRHLSSLPQYAPDTHGLGYLEWMEAPVREARTQEERIHALRAEFEEAERRRELAAEQLRGLGQDVPKKAA